MIALICPTRGRPDQYARMIKSVNDTASSKINIYSASNDEWDKYVERHFPTDCPTVFMWNKLAEDAAKKDKFKLFMLCADDTIFMTPGWDKALLDHYNSLENKIHVYALQDSRDPDGTPHPIVTREYIDAMGYFLPPIFMHWFVDSWTVEIAKANKCFTQMKDFSLVHDKLNDKGMPDDTHNRIRKMGWLSRDEDVSKKCAWYLKEEKHRLALKIGEQHRARYKVAHS